MCAGNARDGAYPPKIIKELIAFLILAPNHPEAIVDFNVVHLESLKPSYELLFRKPPMRHIDTRARTTTTGVGFRMLLKSA